MVVGLHMRTIVVQDNEDEDINDIFEIEEEMSLNQEGVWIAIGVYLVALVILLWLGWFLS